MLRFIIFIAYLIFVLAFLMYIEYIVITICIGLVSGLVVVGIIDKAKIVK